MQKNNFTKPDRGSTPQPDHIMLSFCGDPRYEMAVTWRTDLSAEDGFVLLTDSKGEQEKIDAICRVIESDIDISKFNTAILKNLEAGSSYTYTCGDNNNRSGEFTFTTQEENCDNFKFIVISDQQVGDPWPKPDYSPLKNMLNFALKRDPDIRFILTAGDNCDDGQNELQWNGMFSGLDGIVESLPYMMTTGNHDNRGFKKYLPEPPEGKFYLDHADFFDEQFKYSYPLNGPKGFETENYSFDYGNVHFCIMGINEPQLVGDWAYENLKNSQAQWKLGCYHFPIYPAIPEGQNDDGYPWLRKGIESCDLVFEGHEHTFARTYPIKGDAMFEKPSEGTVHYQCSTGSGGKRSNERKIWHNAYYAQEVGTAAYALVEVNKGVLTITTCLADGKIADKFVIDKDNDEILPPSLPPIFHETRMMYKGSMPQICAKGTVCEAVNGVWFAPFGVLCQYIGAAVSKDGNRLAVDMFGKKAVFTEGSNTADVNGEEFDLESTVYMKNGQLMIGAKKAAEIFGIRCEHIEYNNILDFETDIESTPLSKQQ
ncbi:MAG: metallophosphoesterase [Clostridia bacterium]|nr:metallophosphoesterase [Clostridia bacterium]